MQISEIFQAMSIIGAAVTIGIAALTFARTQKWQQLRFATEVIDKIYSDDNLRLALRFLDWHDREMVLPETYAQYGDAKRKFNHKIANMTIAMSIGSREYDKGTRVYDLKEEYRKPQFIIYVEVFDQFFDYLCQIHTFIEAGLIDDKNVTPIAYFIRRLDALGIFRAFLEKYEGKEVLDLMSRFRISSPEWVQPLAP